MIICSKCGTQNPLGRLYCLKCRTKLDLEQVEHKDILQPDRSATRARTRLFIVLFVIALISVALTLSLLPDLPPPHRYVPQEAQVAARKIDLLERGFNANQTFSEAELNSFLASLKGGASPVRFSLQIYPDAIMVNMAKTMNKIELFGQKFGPFIFTKRLTFVLDKESGKLKLSGGKLGRLPLPGATAKMLVPYFNKTIRESWKNANLLNSVSVIKMSEKTIVIAIKK